MSCNGCNQQTPCEPINCGCPIPDLSAECVVYKGDKLSCIGAEVPENLEVLLKKFDTAICAKLEDIIQQGNLVNIGEGIKLYAGTDNQGQRQIRTLLSSDGSIQITLNPEEESVDFVFNGETFTLERESSTADAQIVSEFDSVNNKYTFKGLKSDSITIEEDTEGNITLEVVATPQAQSDYLQDDNANAAFIKNRLPQKTINITDSYNVTDDDNHHVIEIKNNRNEVVIDLQNISIEDNFFVGFLQNGDAAVRFVNYDIIPSNSIATLAGKGHVAAVEVFGGTIYLHGNLLPV